MGEKLEYFRVPEIIPHDYVNVFYSSKIFRDSPLVAITPANFAIGDIIKSRETELNQRIREYQENLRVRYENQEVELTKKHQRILTYSFEELLERLISSIKKEKGTKKLLSYGGKASITDACLKYDTLTARVISRRSGRKKDILSTWAVEVKSPFYREGSAVDYRSIYSQAEDYEWGRVRPVDVLSSHMAAAILQFAEDFYKPEDERIVKIIDPIGVPYTPFILDKNTEIEVLIRHYLMNESYYKINRRLFDNPEIFDPLYIEAIKSGFITFEVIPHRKSVSWLTSFGYYKSLKYVEDELRKRLKNAGFKKTVLPVIEFKGTKWETICPNYERDDESVRLVFNRRFPPLIVYRRESGDFDIFYKKGINPFSVIGEDVYSVDDKRRRVTKTTVSIPGPEMSPNLGRMPVMGNFKEKYRELIEKHYKGDKKDLKGRLGLGRF